MSVVRSLPWLHSVDAKLDRAHEHLDIIDREIENFIKGTRHTFVPKTNPHTNEAWIVWWMDEPSHPPLSISVEIGEFLYNLRSALDNLVCALVRNQKNDASCSGNGFPIHINCDTFDAEAPRSLKGVPPPSRTLIQELQPYSRGDQAADIDPLNILNTLRNRDTHRALHLGLAYHRNTQLLLSDSFTGKILAYAALPETIYPASGPQTIALPISAADMPAMVDVKVGSTRGVRFREEGPWGERSVIEVLVACMDYVENRVIARFKPFFNQ